MADLTIFVQRSIKQWTGLFRLLIINTKTGYHKFFRKDLSLKTLQGTEDYEDNENFNLKFDDGGKSWQLKNEGNSSENHFLIYKFKLFFLFSFDRIQHFYFLYRNIFSWS